MSLRALLRTQMRWARRRVAVLLLVFVVLPGVVATSAVLFGDVLPRDAPVAVVADTEATTEDVELLTATLQLFAHPQRYETRHAAFRALDREQVYAVVIVPGGLAESGDVTVDMYVDGRMVPYLEPSGAVASAIGYTLDRNLDADVSVERHVRGRRLDLAAYLLPTFLFGFLGVIAFAFLPYVLAREVGALDRVRVESSLEAYLTAKLGFLVGLMLLPLVAFGAVATWLGFPVAVLTPTALVVSLATFLAFAATSSAITFLTEFSTGGRLTNVLVLFGVLGLSGVAYPAGFFSPLRREVIRVAPTHYAAVLMRNAMVKDLGAASYPTAVWIVAGLVVGSLVLAELGLVVYRRRV